MGKNGKSSGLREDIKSKGKCSKIGRIEMNCYLVNNNTHFKDDINMLLLLSVR